MMKLIIILIFTAWCIVCVSDDSKPTTLPTDKTENTSTSKISISNAFGAVLGQNLEENVKRGGKGPLGLELSASTGFNSSIFKFKPKNPVIIKQGDKSFDIGTYTLYITSRFRVYKIVASITINPVIYTADLSKHQIVDAESHIKNIVSELERKYGNFNFVYKKKQGSSLMEEVGEISDPRLMDRKIIVTKTKTSINIEYYAGDVEKQDRLNETVSGGNL